MLIIPRHGLMIRPDVSLCFLQPPAQCPVVELPSIWSTTAETAVTRCSAVKQLLQVESVQVRDSTISNRVKSRTDKPVSTIFRTKFGNYNNFERRRFRQ